MFVSNLIGMGNTTRAGVAQPTGIIHFCKYTIPPASANEGCFDSFSNIEQVNQSHQLNKRKKENEVLRFT
jgi:hypothetical protein